MKITDKELHIFAATLWGEARGEGLDGMVAVAWVIKTRAERRKQDIVQVCLARRQFSMWNESDPNRVLASIMTVERRPYQLALYAALGVLLDEIPDPTDGADHYHSTNIPTPYWASEMVYTGAVGNHLFYDSN